jgi:hypothetical protein
VLFDPRVAPEDIKASLPILVVRMESYKGPAFCDEDPKLVLIEPIERRSTDCNCPCSRYMLPVRIAEGTTIHSLQGINVGSDPPRQVKRLAIDFGKAASEAKTPNLGMVAQSRPQSKHDFCYSKPVDLPRLAVCGSGEGAKKLQAAEAAFAQRAEQSDARHFTRDDYETLLAWAERYAHEKHGILPSWSRLRYHAHVIAFRRHGGAITAATRRAEFQLNSAAHGGAYLMIHCSMALETHRHCTLLSG